MAMEDTRPVIRKLDEIVVNRIAAGEVVQRPANAVKEMLENCLDAGATTLTVCAKSGGLKMLQISDNGHGIRREDLPIVCERFTTSKLREFSDLQTIATFGFRGEALASISHIAHLTIKTRTADTQCAYKANYIDGKMTSTPQPTAGNVGTQIIAEDLFYNVPTRRRALSNYNEEFIKISEMMTRYAIHNSGVAFTLKKLGEGNNPTGSIAVRTLKDATKVDNVSSLFGANIAKEIMEINDENKSLKFKVSGLITNPNCRLKKFCFILFINNRLVECSTLKRVLDSVYQMYLPSGSRPFVYLSLSIDPNNVDVNVHPTKNEVHFLHESEIIDAVKDIVEKKVLSCDSTRTFYTQTLLPASFTESSQSQTAKTNPKAQTSDNSEKKNNKVNPVYDHYLVRTDSKLQKLDSFLCKKKSEHKSSTKAGLKEGGGKPMSEEMDVSENLIDTTTVTNITKVRQIQLTSVLELQTEVMQSTNKALLELIKDHSFVGCMDAEIAFVQHSTKLFMCNTTNLSQQLFYQILLKDFGNFGLLKFSEPLSIYELVSIGIETEGGKWCPADGDKDKLARNIVSSILEKADMLEDYFSIKIEDESLIGLPMLLLEYEPTMEGLPLFLLRLSTEVNWESEKECFFTLCTELSRFYSVRKGYTDLNDHISSDNDNTTENWKYTIEHVIYRNMQKHLQPPESFMNDGTFLQVANLPDLYKVFERC